MRFQVRNLPRESVNPPCLLSPQRCATRSTPRQRKESAHCRFKAEKEHVGTAAIGCPAERSSAAWELRIAERCQTRCIIPAARLLFGPRYLRWGFAMLEAVHLTKRYASIPAVQDLSFSLR